MVKVGNWSLKWAEILIVGLAWMLSILFSGCNWNNDKPVAWDKCTKSSNWHGSNAQWRMMNVLSPHMPDNVFEERLKFMKDRGCNCVHVILCNKGDGEYAGYSIYGNGISWTLDPNYYKKMDSRIKRLRKESLGIVLWLTTDDSDAWSKELAKNPQKYVDDIASLGWFKIASTVCIGLELDEYYNVNQVTGLVAAVRTKYSGKVAVHHTSGKATFVGLGDILFWQVNPTDDSGVIRNECAKALKYGKPVNMFETWRQENRKTSEIALQNGCYGVGNW